MCQRIAEGLIVAASGGSRGAAGRQIDADKLRHVSCVARLERDFDTVPGLAAWLSTYPVPEVRVSAGTLWRDLLSWVLLSATHRVSSPVMR